jgi:DNA-binding NarL/FixJ family response regulator
LGSRPQKISILLAIGPTLAAELSVQAFNRQPSFRVVSRATTVDEAVEAARTLKIDVALITSSLKDGPRSGILALQKMNQSFPSLKSVIFFENSETQLVTTAFRAGAKGVFFPALDGFKSLCRCVKQVNAGQIWANSAQLGELLASFSRQAPVRVVNAGGVRLLTNREEDIVRLVEDGLTNRQIAQELQLSEHTVRNNLFRIFDKLGVSTRVELALYTYNRTKLVAFDESPGDGNTGPGVKVSPLLLCRESR